MKEKKRKKLRKKQGIISLFFYTKKRPHKRSYNLNPSSSLAIFLFLIFL